VTISAARSAIPQVHEQSLAVIEDELAARPRRQAVAQLGQEAVVIRERERDDRLDRGGEKGAM
jgi:hypothetical protein